MAKRRGPVFLKVEDDVVPYMPIRFGEEKDEGESNCMRGERGFCF